MEQNENNKIETTREENAEEIEEAAHPPDQRQAHRRSHPRLRALEDCLPLPGL